RRVLVDAKADRRRSLLVQQRLEWCEVAGMPVDRGDALVADVELGEGQGHDHRDVDGLARVEHELTGRRDRYLGRSLTVMTNERLELGAHGLDPRGALLSTAAERSERSDQREQQGDRAAHAGG